MANTQAAPAIVGHVDGLGYLHCWRHDTAEGRPVYAGDTHSDEPCDFCDQPLMAPK